MTGRVGFPRSSWTLVVAIGFIWFAFGVVFYIPLDILFGNGPASAYSAMAQKELSASSRVVAAFLTLTGVLQILLGAGPFRRGEKWSWYAYAAFPFFGVLGFYAIYLGGGEMVFTMLMLVVLPLSALLFSARSAFSIKQ